MGFTWIAEQVASRPRDAAAAAFGDEGLLQRRPRGDTVGETPWPERGRRLSGNLPPGETVGVPPIGAHRGDLEAGASSAGYGYAPLFPSWSPQPGFLYR